MAGFNLEQERCKVNAELKAGRIPLSVIVRNDRLYLRGTLPPKPGSSRLDRHQQDITLGVYANAPGLKRAKAEALNIAADLAMQRFDWGKYQKVKTGKPQTVSDWVQAFEQDYFNRRERGPKSETTWEKDYRDPFRKLPPEALISTSLLLEVIHTKKPDTRTRKRFCTAYKALATFAGIELDISRLKGRYSPKSVQPRELPSDELILEWRDRQINEEWLWAYSVIVAYGLRPHELFHIDLDSIRKSELAHVTDGKTGEHWILPVLPSWWDDWSLYDVKMPDVQAKNNRQYGARARYYIKLKTGMSFPLYHLRHAWAARAAREGLPDTIAARLQGHSPQIHHAVYQRFLNESHLLLAWERTKRSDVADDD